MNKKIFNNVFNNSVLRVYIFQQVRSIHVDYLREKSLKWKVVECKPYLLTGYNYFQLLKEYYKQIEEKNKKWYHKFKSYSLKSDRTIYHTLRIAVQHDRLEIINMIQSPRGRNMQLLQWLTEKISNHNIEEYGLIYCVSEALVNAAIVGRIDMIEYLMSQCDFTTIPETIQPYILENGVMSGSIEMIEWILGHGVKYKPMINYIELSAKYGHLNLVQYFEMNNIGHFTSRTIDNAVRSNNFQLVEWLHYNQSESFQSSAMDLSARMGLTLLKWFHSNRTEGCTIRSMINASFSHDLETVKWLRENRSDSYNNRILNEIILNSHPSSYEILQYLYDQNLYEKFNINLLKLDDIFSRSAHNDRREDILNFMIDYQNQLFPAFDLKKELRILIKRHGYFSYGIKI
ncbi:hypothetical protein PPL_11042 [Heterostelium album PN500]|uniref:Ankyrin repeat protein n=1 Tax=Heterostelium pallidum (strain ATCC 26659 / Pp 5 / PN500) TaxID=670386 RepID=D3BSS2_HETP5|nr:hypothetical protein PPL_11042 [Heterostelium album PN500]EFA75537.1 hypothetical protein PPL_11042 [Heterostelium album PN500]|eukprot:XP_020427671.1 hypothetical protein PPL_11042 [Heterostelium album PN500]